MIKIVTHDGKFHPDEIFACVLLSYFKDEKLSFIRTRKNSILNRYKNDSSHYVIDVGGEYQSEMLNFDHHQSTFNECGLNGDVYSSCGLIWKHLLEDLNVKEEFNLSDKVISNITEFTIAVDRHDNGVEFFPELEFVSMYNFSYSTTRFEKAFRTAKDYFVNKMRLWKHLDEIDVIEDQALLDAEDGIIFSESKISVNEKINNSSNYLLVCERGVNEYSITSLNKTSEVDFSVRCPAPSEWGGKSGEDIEIYDKNLVFCHKNLFMTVVKGTKEDALKIAKYIVNSHINMEI